MSYCLVRSLAMLMAHQGHRYPVEWLECVSGEVFGTVYINNGKSILFVTGFAYHIAGEHLLRTLNFPYTFSGATDEAQALAALSAALREDPVVAGMLDMGYLTYAPDHAQARGADHAIVVLALTEDAVIVHDPNGYVGVTLPLGDFMRAWERDIYTGKPYGLWRIGPRGAAPTEEVIWHTTIARARANLTRASKSLPDGTPAMYGPAGILALADLLRAHPEQGLGALPYFSWRVSAQRCLDGANFLRARMPAAADIRWEQCLTYGTVQQASASGDRATLPALLERLADQETRFTAAVLAAGDS